MSLKRKYLYLVNFLIGLHMAIPMYINSSFLGEFLEESLVGLVYTIGSIVTILVFITLPKLLSKFGNYRVGMTVVIGDLLSMMALSYTKDPIYLLISFVLMLVLIRIIMFNTDIFLESVSEDKETGHIRGFFLSFLNLAVAISPFLGGLLLGELNNYSRLYFVAGILTIPIILIFTDQFKDFKDPKYDNPSFIGTLKEVWTKSNIRIAIVSNVLLRFFFSIMVIYSPIYLHEHIGFSWSEIGLMMSIVLLPYVFLELPLGEIADKYIGEKEILIAGFFITAVSTAYLSFINSSSFILWTSILVITRIGASMIEITSETYFFKKTDSTDSNLIGFFRTTGPFAYTLGPLFATILLAFIDIKYIFLALGIVLLWGIKYAYNLKDTL